MAASKCFVVLAPNGRRQNVKVTPNTTILQVLEEVCKKQGFKPEEYDITHHNHVLDTTQIIRFTGLPNNAFLEMAAAQKTRQEKNVVLGLQLESGSRVTGDFLPTDTLWNVIKKLSPDEADPDSNPVIIYMRREISGIEALEETTLRSLGLTGGRAMLRFLHRTPEELHHQANISGPLLPRAVEKTISQVDHEKLEAPPECPAVEEVSKSSSGDKSNEDNMDISEIDVSKALTNISQQPSKIIQNIQNVSDNEALSLQPPAQSFVQQPKEIMDVDTTNSQDTESIDTFMDFSSSESDTLLPSQSQHEKPSEDKVIVLGERNAVAFNLEMAQTVPYEDLPDDFFELTLEDARAIYRDLKRRRAEMDEAPLLTNAQKSLDESKRILNQIHKYRRVVIRIQFPDRTVLQGTFLPLETISTVMDFVRGHLQDPQTQFYLFTTPPKTVLTPGSRLVDTGCVPSALVHFGTDDTNCTTYLQESILSQFSSPSAATIAACQSRGIVPTPRPVSAPIQAKPNRNPIRTADGKAEDQPSTSSHKGSNSTRQSPYRQGGPNSNVPKWFRPIK